jgi:hypothetical protein
MIRLALLTALLLVGCGTTTVPVARKFPELPPVLREECKDLIKLEKADKNTPFSIIDLLGTNVENYRRGVECKIKHSATVEWHDTQRQIFDKVK